MSVGRSQRIREIWKSDHCRRRRFGGWRKPSWWATWTRRRISFRLVKVACSCRHRQRLVGEMLALHRAAAVVRHTAQLEFVGLDTPFFDAQGQRRLHGAIALWADVLIVDGIHATARSWFPACEREPERRHWCDAKSWRGRCRACAQLFPGDHTCT